MCGINGWVLDSIGLSKFTGSNPVRTSRTSQYKPSKRRVIMSKTLQEQLGGVFINGRGEVCSNLETTKSKVGSKVREKRQDVESSKDRRQEVGEAKRKLRELRNKEREMEQKIKILRSEGLTHGPGTKACVECFSKANEVNNELRGVRKGIRKLNKRIHR